ncbi:MAG: SRPBCC domain-containing protein [Dongiaceae bacterium]
MIAIADATESVDRTLKIIRNVAAPRDEVWRAFTVRDCYAAWMGPENFKVERCELDLRSGGRYRLFLRSNEGEEHVASGEFQEIIPNERLVFTWGWETEGRRGTETTVTIEFRDHAKGTQIKLTQSVFETLESRDEHAEGWESSLVCLEKYLSK